METFGGIARLGFLQAISIPDTNPPVTDQVIVYFILIPFVKDEMFSFCLFVCLAVVIKITQKLWTNVHQIMGRNRSKDQGHLLFSRSHLRSAARGDLAIPRLRMTTYGQRSFSVSGPSLWNSLPLSVRES